jgi:hypothetical protein
MKRITIKSKLKIAFPVILGLLFLSYGNKTSHPAINKIIVEGFVSRNNKYEFSMVKFQDYVFNLNIGKLKGDFIVESGLFNPSEVSRVGDISVGEQNTTYTERSREITAQEWIEHGGYSADVPEVPASLRHFYDRSSKTRKQTVLTGLLENKETLVYLSIFIPGNTGKNT